MATAYNTDWSGIPMTDASAEPVCLQAVSDAVVIHITRASIRDAIVENVTFELANLKNAYGSYAGKPRAEVRCLWYGRKPPTSWMHLTLLGPHTEERNYTGEVVWDFGRAPKL